MGNGWMGLPDLASNIGDYFATQQKNATDDQRIDRANAFSANQSSTIYQRGVADMKAAGLNPILAAGSPDGAATSANSAAMAASLHQGSVPTANIVSPQERRVQLAGASSAESAAVSNKAKADIDASSVAPEVTMNKYLTEHPRLNIIKKYFGAAGGQHLSSAYQALLGSLE